jgi:putative FmdB family regulatory protein
MRRGDGRRGERDERGRGRRVPRARRASPPNLAGSLAAPVPIYEYKCPNGHLFEVFHGMTEDGPSVCDVCGEGPLQRVLHPVAVHYKGSGFYSTDYGRKSKQSPKDGGGSSSDSSGGSSSGESSSGGGGGSEQSGGDSKKAAEA